MKIAACSLFRDSQEWYAKKINQVDRFFKQLEQEKCITSYHLVEGNSIDNTYQSIMNWSNHTNTKVELIKHDVVGSEVASVVSVNRFKNLSTIGNLALESAKKVDADFIFWIESDFIFEQGLISNLLKFSEYNEELWQNSLGVCPVPRFGNSFYDTWAFKGINGETWSNNDLEKFKKYPLTYLELSSFGSCALMNAKKIKEYNLSFGVDGCFPELCRQAKSFGLKLFCDTTQIIEHPSSDMLGGRLV